MNGGELYHGAIEGEETAPVLTNSSNNSTSSGYGVMAIEKAGVLMMSAQQGQPGHIPDLPMESLKKMLLTQLEYYFSP
jgi:hypothetical protein